ncbi:MAG: SEC-C metal-binding domain-containing protein, partial [Oligoflexia bacterium]
MDQKISSDQSETQFKQEAKSVGRNEPCPCGSGSKYKRCCGKDAAPKLGKPADLQSKMAQLQQSGGLPPG